MGVAVLFENALALAGTGGFGRRFVGVFFVFAVGLRFADIGFFAKELAVA